MKTFDLGHDWYMAEKDTPCFLPAGDVPCSVYMTLLQNGKMEDPYWRDNENKALPLMEKDYLFRKNFDVPDEMFDCTRLLLRCEGLDTVATLTLNGQPVAQTDNMHRTYEFDVKNLLKPTGNELTILLDSPTRTIRERDLPPHAGGSDECMKGFPNLRKAHCMFGWDWGPRLPDAGIWRPISLVGVEEARLPSVYVTQRHENGTVTLELSPEIENLSGVSLSYDVTLTAPDGTEQHQAGSPRTLVVENPQLWWPNGLGEQPLYTLTVTLLAGGKPVDTWQRRIGLRTQTMKIEKDEWGESFATTVNGVSFFAMGADYIPEDNLFPRRHEKRTRHLLQQAVLAHHNAIRVWGGGHYPDDWFYDACDELGLVVWQDFMFACANYNLTEAFEENVRAEFADNIRRLRHHASLGLWCGNNEMEQFTDDGIYGLTPWQKGNYVRLYEYIIPHMLRQLDPNTFYWPSSPSSGGDFDDPRDPNRGDVHYWEVWHGNLPFTDYRNHYFRYVSEFGFQSFPTLKTVESFTEPEDRNIFSYVMEKHQRNNAANGKIMNYMAQTFRYPTDFATLLYASQLLSAEAIRYGVEHWRRNRGRCMGAIVWQLNDIWPVASWASIDYFGRWKALHYYEKRFFRPVLLSCCEEGMLSQEPNPNAQPHPIRQSIRLNVSNETRQEKAVTVHWQLRRNTGDVLLDGKKQTLTVPPMSAVWLPEIDLPQADPFTDYVSYEMIEDGVRTTFGSAIFSMPKYFRYVDPQITCRVEGDELIVISKAYAHAVELLNEQEDWVLSDNYFDLNPGEEKRVRILSGQAQGIHIRSAFDIG